MTLKVRLSSGQTATFEAIARIIINQELEARSADGRVVVSFAPGAIVEADISE
jgi:hypothetical protein